MRSVTECCLQHENDVKSCAQKDEVTLRKKVLSKTYTGTQNKIILKPYITPSTALHASQVCGRCVWVYCSALRNMGRSNPTPELRTAHHWTNRHYLQTESAGRRLKENIIYINININKINILYS